MNDDFYKRGFWLLIGLVVAGGTSWLLQFGMGRELQSEIDKKADWERIRPIVQTEVEEDMESHEKVMAERLAQIHNKLDVIEKEIEKNSRTIEAGLTTQRSFLAETARLWVRIEDWMEKDDSE